MSGIIRRCLLSLLGIVAIGAAAAGDGATTVTNPAAASAGMPGVVYDRRADRLSIAVDDQPLSDVLLQVARQSGIDVRLDPRADGPVTLHVDRLPPGEALDRLGRYNVVRQYARAGKKKLLVRVTVLPAGQADQSGASSLIAVDREVDYRAGEMSMAQEAMRRRGEPDDLVMQRWKARLGNLTPAQKERYDARQRDFAAREEQKRQRDAADALARRQRDEAQFRGLPVDLQAAAREGGAVVDPGPDSAARAARDFPTEKTPAIVYPDQGK